MVYPASGGALVDAEFTLEEIPGSFEGFTRLEPPRKERRAPMLPKLEDDDVLPETEDDLEFDRRRGLFLSS